MRVLWVCFVWPEPRSSAAGVRTLQLLHAAKNAGHEVRVFSPCKENQYKNELELLGIRTECCEPNDTRFDTLLGAFDPECVIFDRFMIEEQFGWRVRHVCPEAIRVLDTVDLHSLRRARQRKIEEGSASCGLLPGDWHTDDALREIAAIFRCDLTLVVSESEKELLNGRYQVPHWQLEVISFLYPLPEVSVGFEPRQHLVSIGNFQHPPNADSVRVLHQHVWDPLRVALRERGEEGVELHVYGAYPPRDLLRLDSARTGFRVKGWTPEVHATLSCYRVNLAPLRFGAGIKGKIADGWVAGTPCVATQIAAEGMHPEGEFGGVIRDEWEAFVEEAARLYVDRDMWRSAQARGFAIVEKHFNGVKNGARFLDCLERVRRELGLQRQRNVVGAMLWHHQMRSTEFFSRWIEAKGRLAQQQRQ